MEYCASQSEPDWKPMVESAKQLLKDQLYEQALEVLMRTCETGGAQRVAQVWEWVEECCKGLAFSKEHRIAQLQKFFALSGDSCIFAEWIGGEYSQIESYAKAEDWFRRAIKLDPQQTETYFYLEKTLYHQKKFDQILPTIQLCVKLFPNDKEVLLWACKQTKSLCFVQKVAEFYEKLIKLEPTNIEYYFGYIRYDLHSDDYHIEKCKTYIEAAAKLSKHQSYKEFFLRGFIYYNERKYRSALSILKKALAMDPSQSECAFLIGNIYQSAGQYRMGISFLSSHLPEQPNNQLDSKLARLYWLAGDYKACARIVDSILTRQSESTQYFLQMVSVVLRCSGQIERAIQYCNHCLTFRRRGRQKSRIYSNLYQCYLAKSDKQKAVQSLIISRNSTKMSVFLNIQLAKLCLETDKVELCYTIIQEIESKLGTLQLQEKVSFLRLLEKANQLDRCLQIYDTHLVVSKAKLDLSSLFELYLTLAECHRKLGNIGGAIEAVIEIEALLEMKNTFWPTKQIVPFIEIQLHLFNYQRVETLYQLLKKQMESQKMNGYRWEQVQFATEMNRYETILKEQYKQATPS